MRIYLQALDLDVSLSVEVEVVNYKFDKKYRKEIMIWLSKKILRK